MLTEPVETGGKGDTVGEGETQTTAFLPKSQLFDQNLQR